MNRLRFLQFSDAHIDPALTHVKLGWPPDKREQRIGEINKLIADLPRLAQERQVEAVLIPGDLWDDETVSADTAAMVIETCAAFSPIPVFIAPGNHDFYSPLSFYNPDILRLRSLPVWPDNVFIFRSEQFQTIIHPTRPDVSLTGRAFHHHAPTAQRWLAQPIVRPETPISILLFHGSLLSYEGPDANLPGKSTAPFSADELVDQNFSYAALGHYHHYTELVDMDERIRAAYAGCLAGRGPTETGSHFVLVGELDAQGVCGELEKIRLDRRAVYHVIVDLSDATTDTLIERIGRQLQASGATAEDIVYLQLTGRIRNGQPVTGLTEPFQGRYFYLGVRDHTRPAYELDTPHPHTTQGEFIRQMQRHLDAATNQAERSQCEHALYYGLDALLQGEVRLRYED